MDLEFKPKKEWLANKRRIDKTRGLNEKCTCLTKSSVQAAGSGGVAFYVNGVHRSPSISEFERLQTVPVGYTSGVSRNQAISMLGNGWTVDVIAHIFKGIL